MAAQLQPKHLQEHSVVQEAIVVECKCSSNGIGSILVDDVQVSKHSCAPCQNWTSDLCITSATLYHYAKEAIFTNTTLIKFIFCYDVNFFDYRKCRKFWYDLSELIEIDPIVVQQT